MYNHVCVAERMLWCFLYSYVECCVCVCVCGGGVSQVRREKDVVYSLWVEVHWRRRKGRDYDLEEWGQNIKKIMNGTCSGCQSGSRRNFDNGEIYREGEKYI